MNEVILLKTDIISDLWIHRALVQGLLLVVEAVVMVVPVPQAVQVFHEFCQFRLNGTSWFVLWCAFLHSNG